MKRGGEHRLEKGDILVGVEGRETPGIQLRSWAGLGGRFRHFQ